MTEARSEPPSPEDQDQHDGKGRGETFSERENQNRRPPEGAQGRDIRVAAGSLIDGLDSMGVSVRANTLIIGDASVGTLVGRDNHVGAVSAQFVPSGPVPATLLDHLEHTFVPPGGFRKICRHLRGERLLLLRAARGWGRTAVAIRALIAEGAERVHKLHPDVVLRTLDVEFIRGTGYLLESLEVDQASTLHAFHLEQLGRGLVEHGCFLIVILDDTVGLPVDAEPFVVDGGEPVGAVPLIHSHLRRHLPTAKADVLADVRFTALLADVTRSRPSSRDLAALGAQLAEVINGERDLAEVADRYSVAADSRFQQWFDDELDTETRSLAIALAVLNRMPLHVVHGASRALSDLIIREEVPDASARTRSVFGVRNDELLRRIRAEAYRSEEDTVYGRIRVDAAKFVDDRYSLRILEHVWREYPAAHQLVRDWLRELGADPDFRVCSRAGLTVGLLAIFEFEHVRALVIEPWADSGDVFHRLSAVGALQLPALEPDLAPLVVRMLDAWGRRGMPLARRVTAAAALGTTVGRTMPERAIQMLRRAARSDEPVLQEAVCYSMFQLFEMSELTGRILRELVRWTEASRPSLRDTGYHCVRVLSSEFSRETPRGALAWPGLVWLAAESDEHRATIVTLFARLMEAPGHMPDAYDEIRRWVSIAEKDPQLRAPLGRLLIELGEAIQDADLIVFHLREWSRGESGPLRAAEQLIEMHYSKG